MEESSSSYKRLVTGEDCEVVAVDAIRDLLERTMESALRERIAKHVERHGAGSDRRNGMIPPYIPSSPPVQYDN